METLLDRKPEDMISKTLSASDIAHASIDKCMLKSSLSITTLRFKFSGNPYTVIFSGFATLIMIACMF